MFPSFISRDNDPKKTKTLGSPGINKENSQSKTNQLEESKEKSPEGQENEKKKSNNAILRVLILDWSFGNWWKKPKEANNGHDAKEQSTAASENNISNNITKKFEKFGNYSKNLINQIANNVQAQFLEPGALGDPLWGDFSSNKKEEQKAGNPNHKVDQGMKFLC